MDQFDIDRSKMAAFGQWLTEQTVQKEAELYSTCANIKYPLDGIRLKYGHLEAYKYILQAFSKLFQGELEEFKKEYLEVNERKEDD